MSRRVGCFHAGLLALALAGAGCGDKDGGDAPPPARDVAGRQAAALDAAIDDPGVEVSAAEGSLRVVLPEGSLFSRGEPILFLEEGEAALSEVAEAIRPLGGEVEVVAHTDDTGSEGYAQDLTERQAQAVAEALAAGGVPARRIRAWGRGEREPVAENDSPRNRSLNRRVEIVAHPGRG